MVQSLERVCAQTGYPSTIRVDNGSEFISRDLDLWAYANNVTVDFSRPGKPTDNGFIEAFNGKLRAECLSERQIEARAPTERGPLPLWVRLTRAAENHNGLVRILTDWLSETAGLGPACSFREPDLAALVRAATRLHEDRSTPVATRAACYTSGASEDPAKPASASCSGSGRSRKDSIPKAARNVSVVTKV